MGRNGKKDAVFTAVVKFISSNFNKEVSSKEILLGKEPGRNAETAYLYKFIKLGYVEPLDNCFVSDKQARFKIVKELNPRYTSVMIKKDLRLINGFAGDI